MVLATMAAEAVARATVRAVLAAQSLEIDGQRWVAARDL